MNISVRQYWTLLVDYLRPQRTRVWVLAALLAAGIALQLFNPQLMRYVIDTALATGPIEAVTAAALLFLVLAAFQQLCSVVTTYVSETIAWTATNNLRFDLARHA